jgi:hypothetical protein
MSTDDEMLHSAISPGQVTLVRRNISHGDNPLLRHAGLCLPAGADHGRLATSRYTMH